jgi:hypothetical protein
MKKLIGIVLFVLFLQACTATLEYRRPINRDDRFNYHHRYDRGNERRERVEAAFVISIEIGNDGERIVHYRRGNREYRERENIFRRNVREYDPSRHGDHRRGMNH